MGVQCIVKLHVSSGAFTGFRSWILALLNALNGITNLRFHGTWALNTGWESFGNHDRHLFCRRLGVFPAIGLLLPRVAPLLIFLMILIGRESRWEWSTGSTLLFEIRLAVFLVVIESWSKTVFLIIIVAIVLRKISSLIVWNAGKECFRRAWQALAPHCDRGSKSYWPSSCWSRSWSKSQRSRRSWSRNRAVFLLVLLNCSDLVNKGAQFALIELINQFALIKLINWRCCLKRNGT